MRNYKYNPQTAIKYAHEDESTDLKSYIKSALNVEQNNNTLDSIMNTAFNVENPNPMYVFVLPVGLQNRTLVLRRSDFGHAIFPNISRLQRQIMSSNISRLYKLIENFDKPTWMSEQSDTTTEFLFTNDDDTHNADLDEAESMKVVEENVRTERNFYKFMHYLNQHHETDNTAGSDLKYIENADLLPSGSAVVGRYTKLYKPSQSQIEYSLHIDYTTAQPIAEKPLQTVSWKDLGLDGWMGGIKEPGKGFDNIMRFFIFFFSFSVYVILLKQIFCIYFFTVTNRRKGTNQKRRIKQRNGIVRARTPHHPCRKDCNLPTIA